MDLATISMDRNAARAAFLEYRQAFRDEQAAIDGELMRGYKELAGGRQLIRLSETIQSGGADELGRPRLAVARADEPRVTFERTPNGAVTFTPNIEWRDAARSADRVLRFGDGTLPPLPVTNDNGWVGSGTWAAIMPLIPPHLRPPHNLENYHILWEAAWTRPATRRAPGDPALLRRIGGDLWAVLAIWDLSPLERAVLEMRRPSR